MNNVIKLLENVKTKTIIFERKKRLEMFTAPDAIKVLAKAGLNSSQIRKEIETLLDEGVIAKVDSTENTYTYNNSIKFGMNDCYVWTSDKYNFIHLLGLVVCFFLVIAVVLFKFWPLWLRKLVSYSAYPIGGFVTFLVVLAILRLIIYSITFLVHKPMWLFPNLFADCGFFASFCPLYEYEKSKDD